MKNRIRFLITFLTVIFLFSCEDIQKTFHTEHNIIAIKVNDKVITKNWKLSPESKPDIFLAECQQASNVVTFSDGKDSISFSMKYKDTIDFSIILNQKDTALTRIIGIRPNINFSQKYIEENKGKTIVEIPEVSELANILIALHKDAEEDKNMVDSETEYYQRVKEYFEPHLDHPIIDTIQKYIKDLEYKEEMQHSMFSKDGYWYHYALKMNACSYIFDNNNNIINNGIIRVIAGNGWFRFDPMKDASLMTDFAAKSGFRKFYQQNKPYYNSLLATYNRLNPISKMQQWLDQKFGFSYGNYTVYFSPIVSGAHSTQSFKQEDFNQTFMFIRRADYNNKHSEIMNQLMESKVVFTEIDHNYVNPVSDRHIDRINEAFQNRDFWTHGDMARLYETPYKIFNEYMTWSIYSLYILDNYPEKDVLEYLPILEHQMEKQRGFTRFSSFNRELLRKYVQNKNLNIDGLYQHMFDWSAKQII